MEEEKINEFYEEGYNLGKSFETDFLKAKIRFLTEHGTLLEKRKDIILDLYIKSGKNVNTELFTNITIEELMVMTMGIWNGRKKEHKK